MGRGPSKKLKGFEVVLLLMCDGNPITPEKISKAFANKANNHRISNYIHEMKTKVGAVIKTNKIGKTVSTYQLIMNEETKNYIFLNNLQEKNANI